MAAKKTKTNNKKVKKVTNIPDANVKIEVDEIQDDESIEEETKEETENKPTEDAQEDTEPQEEKKEVVEEKEEEVVENFDDESSSFFSWKKVITFIIIAALTGLAIVGAYLVFFGGYDVSVSKQEAEKKTIDIEETTPTPTPEEVDKDAYDIQVLNGSGIAGEAASVQELLEDEGFSVSEIGNAETADFSNSQILYSEDVDEEFLEALEEVLDERGPTDLEEAPADQTEDVVVIVGSNLSEEDPTPTPELE